MCQDIQGFGRGDASAHQMLVAETDDAPASDTRVIRCPVCQNEENLSLVERFGRFSIHLCPICEVQFADPLSYSAAFYDEHYNSGGLGLTRVGLLTHSSMVAMSHRMISGPQRMVLQWLKRNISTPSDVLEVGFGGGWFLAALEREGYAAMGVEVTKESVEVLTEKGFSVSVASVESLPPDWPAPKAVILLEVLEHLPDPLDFLRKLHDNFPRAPLILSTPSPRRWTLRLDYRESYDYPPHHLTRWNERALRVALRKAGYADIACLYPPVDPAELYSVFLGMILARLHIIDMGSRERPISPEILPGFEEPRTFRDVAISVVALGTILLPIALLSWLSASVAHTLLRRAMRALNWHSILVRERARMSKLTPAPPALRDNQGQSLLSRAVKRFPGLSLRIHDIGRAIFRALMVPEAKYFQGRGWSSGSILAIGLPAGCKEGPVSV